MPFASVSAEFVTQPMVLAIVRVDGLEPGARFLAKIALEKIVKMFVIVRMDFVILSQGKWFQSFINHWLPKSVALLRQKGFQYPNRSVFSRQCRCNAGFTGIHCEQVCSSGRYGPGCREKCRCANQARCDPVTGDCKCSLGYTGRFCDQPCPQGELTQEAKEFIPDNLGRYGINCTLNCECDGNANCDPVQGCCDCPAGRYGVRCQYSCPIGFYGWYCSQVCDCQQNAPCDPSDGEIKGFKINFQIKLF